MEQVDTERKWVCITNKTKVSKKRKVYKWSKKYSCLFYKVEETKGHSWSKGAFYKTL